MAAGREMSEPLDMLPLLRDATGPLPFAFDYAPGIYNPRVQHRRWLYSDLEEISGSKKIWNMRESNSGVFLGENFDLFVHDSLKRSITSLLNLLINIKIKIIITSK